MLSTRFPASWLSLFVCLLLLLAGCQPAPDNGASDRGDAAIHRPDTDRRALRYLELPNRLRVLLVSDPEAEKAAAALDVHVGSRQDPAGRDGLAHFLEHMLFLGTDKFPDAGEYQQFISAHGGNHNAFTAFEHTNYFFDIDTAYLEPALDRFSRFFVAPLFNAAYVEREKNAVHSEFLMRIRDDQRRSLDALRDVVSEGHPFRGFSVGNLTTLADRPDGTTVREELLQFYERYYSANLMTLVVVAPQPLDELEAMVRPRFSPIPDRDVTLEPVTVPLFETPGVRVDIEPITQRRTLTFGWPIPDVRADYRTKPQDFIAHLLGHEGEGSLLSWLKAQGWASGLSAGLGLSYQGGALMSVSVELTPEGQRHVDAITGALYQTLAMIRQEGVEPWLYDEQRRVAEQRFRFREAAKPIWEASRLAGNLHDYPAAEVLRGDYLMERFDAPRIQQLLNLMVPERMVMTLMAPGVETARRSPYYDTPYRVVPLPRDQLLAWRESAPTPAIRLPEPNPFIADSLALKPLEQPQVKPVLLETSPGLQLWFLQEPVFRLPRGNLVLHLALPPVNDDPLAGVMTDLWIRLARESLNEFAYPAYLAGLQYDIARRGTGIEVRIQGFDDKQPLLLERVLTALRQPDLQPELFARVKADYQRQLQDRINAAPSSLLMDDLGVVLQRDRWPTRVMAEVSERATLERVQGFGATLFRQLGVQMLVHGNYRAADARQLADQVRQQLVTPAAPVAGDSTFVLQLPADRSFRRQLQLPHQDAGLVWYRQAADRQQRTRAALGVSAQLLNADFYTRLRTEQQLGYVVMSSAYPVRDLPGMVFLVQSPVAGPQRLAAAYETFIESWRQRDATALRPLFDRHRKALAGRLAEAPESLDAATERYWQDLREGYLAFDSREQLLGEVQSLTFEQWLALFRRDVLQLGGHDLWLASDGRFADEPLDRGQPVGNLKAFKDAQRFVEFPPVEPASQPRR